MMRHLVIMLAGLLLLSLAPGGLCQGCDDSSLSMDALPLRNSHNISVTYTVADGVSHSFNDSICVTVPRDSFFFDVMENAKNKDPTRFSFTYTLSVRGAHITSVRDLAADNTQRTYWQLLSNGRPLKLGAGCYAVSHRKGLEVRFSKY